MHIPDVDDKSYLRNHNWANAVVLHLLRKERMRFHQLCVFPYNILVLVLEDDGRAESYIRAENQTFFRPLLRGRYYFIPTGCRAEYQLLPGIRYYTFHVGFEFYPGIDFYSNQEPCCDGDASAMIRRMEAIWAEEDELHQSCAVRAFLLDFFLSHWPQHRPDVRRSSELIQLLAFIHEHGSAEMTVESLAERLSIHPDTLTRKFKLAFGILPKEYLNNFLVRRASGLLQRPELSIREVAGKLGFHSEYYFSRFMKKRTGFSPGIYRKNFLTGHAPPQQAVYLRPQEPR